MTPDPLDTLNARLTRLERENRRWKRLAGACTVGVAVLACCGAVGDTDPRVLKGERLELSQDRSGSGIALGASREGEPEVTLRRKIGDKTYSMSLRLFVAGVGVPVLIFVDQAGTQRYKVPR